MHNFHATGLLVADRGIAVTGPSGSGKSTLALALIARCRGEGIFARLVGDDQLLLSAAAGRLVARAPAPVEGLVEIHGLGPHPVPHEPAMIVDLVVRLVATADAPRLDPGDFEEILGCRIARITLPRRSAAIALPAILARLKLH